MSKIVVELDISEIRDEIMSGVKRIAQQHNLFITNGQVERFTVFIEDEVPKVRALIGIKEEAAKEEDPSKAYNYV